MVSYTSISTFRDQLAELLAVKRGVYKGIDSEIANAFSGVSIDQIRQNRDMILMDDAAIVIKLRIQDSVHRLSKKDGYRLIYIVSKRTEKVTFLYVYPKRGPKQKLDLQPNELEILLQTFIQEAQQEMLQEFLIPQ